MLAVPMALAVTKPFALTVATAVLLDDHVTFLLVAFEGATVAVSCCVAPTVTVADVGETVTPVTATLPAAIVTLSKVAVFNTVLLCAVTARPTCTLPAIVMVTAVPTCVQV